jgi:predicted house-cleaning noncanonical NTP pyrophosphatase (MazG superfamily)
MKGKLVRDKIPQIIEKNDKRKPRTKILSLKAFERELRKKLVEEATEAAKSNTKNLAGELADVEEIVDALCAVYNLNRSEVSRIQKQKKTARGGFKKRIFLIT